MNTPKPPTDTDRPDLKTSLIVAAAFIFLICTHGIAEFVAGLVR